MPRRRVDLIFLRRTASTLTSFQKCNVGSLVVFCLCQTSQTRRISWMFCANQSSTYSSLSRNEHCRCQLRCDGLAVTQPPTTQLGRGSSIAGKRASQPLQQPAPWAETDFGQTDFGQFWCFSVLPIGAPPLWAPPRREPRRVGPRRVGPRRVRPRRVGGPKGGRPEGWEAQNFALFLTFPAMGVFSWNFGGGAAGASHDNQRTPNVHI